MKSTTHESPSKLSQIGSSVVAVIIALALYGISYAVLFDRYIFPHVSHGIGGFSSFYSPKRTKLLPLWVYLYSPAIEIHKRYRMQDFYVQF